MKSNKTDQDIKQVLTGVVNLIHKAGFSIQFNCFSGTFEEVEQDMKLDYALNCAKDCRVQNMD